MNLPNRPKRTSRCWSPLSARSLSAALLLCACAGTAWAQAGLHLPQWLQRQLVQRVSITGSRQLSFHQHTVTGDTQAFDLGNYGGQGDRQFTDFGNVRVQGQRVFDALNFDFVIQDSRFRDPQGQHFSIDYLRGPWQANLGDIRGTLLNTNRFAAFTKTLRGAMFGYEGGGFRVKTVFSDVRGAPRTVSIPGTNSAGPYYLQSAQIVRGSEHIEVDGVPQVLGQDYVVNYEIGSVTFVNRSTGQGKIIPPTSTIVATYEVFGFSGSSGKLEGAGLAYTIKNSATLGFTGMRQIKGGSGRLSTRLETFQGFGPPSTPYFLQFIPLETEPIVIRVNGILQTEGVDYFFDLDNPSIFFFTRFMPPTDNIDVLYTPKPTTTVDGDRQVTGWDVSVPFGPGNKGGTVRYSEAVGRLLNTPTPTSGLARALELRLLNGPLSLVGTLRSVPSGYVTIETTGFNRNEKAGDLLATWKASEHLTYNASYLNSAISSRLVDSGGNVSFIKNRFSKYSGGLDYKPGGNALPVNLAFTQTRARSPQGDSLVSSTGLSTSRSDKRWETSLSLEHQDASGPVTDGSSTTIKKLSLETMALRTTYRSSNEWTMSLSTGLSQVKSGGEQGLGRDVQATLRWRPNDKLDWSFIAQDSDAGKVAALGFINGYGLGYNGNGFSNGTGLSGLTSASKVRSYTLRGTWDPSGSLSLGARAYTRETAGSFSSNARTDGVGFDTNWQLNGEMSLQGSVDASKTTFLSSPTESTNLVLSTFFNWAPRGPWSYSLGLNQFVSNGSSGFGQNSFTLDTILGYRLTTRQLLSVALYSNRGNGALAQDDTDVSLNYTYQVWRSLGVQASYRLRDVVNKDPLSTSGAYTSRGFDIGLVFNFGS